MRALVPTAGQEATAVVRHAAAFGWAAFAAAYGLAVLVVALT